MVCPVVILDGPFYVKEMIVMSLTMTQIIAMADILVPNSDTNAQKMLWLNEVNNKFFEVVKIPKTATFNTVVGTATTTLASGIRGKNIDKVHVGNGLFPSFLYDNVHPGHNYHLFDDDTLVMTLSPTPTQVLSAIVRYFRMATTTYVDSAPSLASSPDAPSEYHYGYAFGLAEKIAQSLEDISKANNYGGQYNGVLAIAQQNYKGM